jgi:hypothetical protein
MSEEHKFPSEIIDLPSKGKLYPKDSPLSEGKVEIKYMTAREEDILTSQNLIKKGIVIEKLLNSLILTPNVTIDDMVLGDKNAIMVAARILAYGPEYVAQIPNPVDDSLVDYTFDLSECPFKEVPEDVNYSENKFSLELPASKAKIEFKILTGKDEKDIEAELKSLKKVSTQVSPEVTTRLKYSILSINGDDDKQHIRTFVDQHLLSRDSIVLRKEIQRVSPDIELSQEIEMGGESVKVNIPMTVGFFWPEA